VVCTEFARVGFLVLAACDRDRLESHRPRPLHAEMSEPSDAKDRDPVPWKRTGMAQSVVGGDTGAAHRRGLAERQFVGNPRKRGRRRNHRLRVSAWVGNAGDLTVLAMDQVALTALDTAVATAAEPAHAHAIAHGETLYTVSQFGNGSGKFVAQGQRP
jgi:hypothetical protein